MPLPIGRNPPGNRADGAPREGPNPQLRRQTIRKGHFRAGTNSETRNPNALGLGSSQIASLRRLQVSCQEGPIEPWRHDCSATQTEKISPVVAGSAAWDHHARRVSTRARHERSNAGTVPSRPRSGSAGNARWSVRHRSPILRRSGIASTPFRGFPHFPRKSGSAGSNRRLAVDKIVVVVLGIMIGTRGLEVACRSQLVQGKRP